MPITRQKSGHRLSSTPAIAEPSVASPIRAPYAMQETDGRGPARSVSLPLIETKIQLEPLHRDEACRRSKPSTRLALARWRSRANRAPEHSGRQAERPPSGPRLRFPAASGGFLPASRSFAIKPLAACASRCHGSAAWTHGPFGPHELAWAINDPGIVLEQVVEAESEPVRARRGGSW